jgi:hypothetical protein
MFNLRKIRLLFTSIVLFGLGAIFMSVLTLKNVVAQSGDGEVQATPEITSSDQPSSESDQSNANTNSTWSSSAEFPNESTTEAQNSLDPSTFAEPAVGDAVNSLISWRMSGSALRPRENDVSYSVSGSGGCSYVTSGDAFTVWNTSVDLPQGATIDTLRMYFYDTSGSNSSAWFTIYDLYGNIVQEWSVSTSGSGGNSFNDSAQINHTIDYSVYSYLINWRPAVTGNTMQLCGFRIFYEPPPFGIGFLPVLKK